MPRIPSFRLAPIVLIGCCLLPGCAVYSPLPLNEGGSLRGDLGQLDHGGQPLPARLGPDDIGLLALRNNPELRAARAQHDVAQAQLLAAGILPNPSFGGSYGFLLGGPGTMGAISAGISQDLKSVVTLSAKRDSARSAAQEVDASLLWQEWQTVGKARLLAVDLIVGEQQQTLLQSQAAQLDDRLRRSRQALAQGDASLAEVVPDVTAAADLRKQIDDLRRQQDTRRNDLDALLGLAPGASLPLVESLDPASVDADAVRSLLPGLADRRPDLVALQLGYRAQEAKVRAAILAQFPTLNIGLAYGRDSSDVRTLGPQIGFELPIFDRNQGNIALERASRQQLHDEYSNRLDSARSEVLAMLADMLLLQGQLATRQQQQPELERSAESAETAYRNGDLDERGLIDLLSARNSRRQEILALQQTLLEQQVAIATLTGAGMPAVDPAVLETP